MSLDRRAALRVLYAVNVVGAGLPGLLIVLAPDFAESHVLWPTQDRAVMAILGSLWLAIGAVSALGLVHPERFTAVFLVQFVYKSVWIAAFALPRWTSGEPPTGAQAIVLGLFVLLLVEFVCVLRPRDFVGPAREA